MKVFHEESRKLRGHRLLQTLLLCYPVVQACTARCFQCTRAAVPVVGVLLVLQRNICGWQFRSFSSSSVCRLDTMLVCMRPEQNNVRKHPIYYPEGSILDQNNFCTLRVVPMPQLPMVVVCPPFNREHVLVGQGACVPHFVGLFTNDTNHHIYILNTSYIFMHYSCCVLRLSCLRRLWSTLEDRTPLSTSSTWCPRE